MVPVPFSCAGRFRSVGSRCQYYRYWQLRTCRSTSVCCFALAGSGLSRPYGPSEPWLPMPLMIATFAVLLSGLVGLSIITFASLLVSWATVFKWLTVAGSLGILASFIVGYFRHRQAR